MEAFLGIIGWVLACYFIPAFLFAWLSYFFTSRIKPYWLRKTILTSGLTIAWAPGVLTAGHGAYFGQMLVGITVFMPGNFKAMLDLENIILMGVTLVIVAVLLSRSEANAET